MTVKEVTQQLRGRVSEDTLADIQYAVYQMIADWYEMGVRVGRAQAVQDIQRLLEGVGK